MDTSKVVTFELFEKAIEALYGHDGPERQRLANEYLIHVWNHSKQSWEYGLQILKRRVPPGHADPTHTQYFCANMLYAKIRQEWFGLTEVEQRVIQSELELILQQIRLGQLCFAPLVLKRICMAMGVLYLAIDGGCAHCVNECVSKISSILDIQVALELLTCLCDEPDDSYLPPSRKDALVIEITDASTRVFSFLANIFDTNADSSVRIAGLACLKAWIKAAGFSLAKLFTTMPTVFRGILQAFQSPQTDSNAIKEVTLCALILSDALEVTEYPPSSEKEPALAALISTLLACETTIGFYLANDSNVAHALTTLVAAIGESELDWFVVGTAPEALRLIDLMLTLTSQPHRLTASLTFDFWLGIQDYPVASRHVIFQAAIFERLLHVLVRQCAQADLDDEDDGTTAFRQAAVDVVIAIYHLLQGNFLVHIGRMLSTAETKSVVEATMFVLTIIAPDLKLKIVDDKRSQELVQELCAKYVFGNTTFTTVPSVVRATSIFLGHLGSFVNARWTETGDDSLLVASLEYLGFALSVPLAAPVASKAINQLFAACSVLLVRKDLIVSSLLKAMESSRLDAESRDLILQGLVRVACLAPWGRLALDHLLAPTFTRMHRVPLDNSLLDDLATIGTVLRFLDAPSEEAGGSALTQHVLSSTWPHLHHVVVATADNATVAEALGDVFASVVQSMKANAASFAQTSEFSAIVTWLEGHVITTASALQAAITAVELFGPTGSPLMKRLIHTTTTAVMAYCQTVASPAHIPDLLRAFFELMQRSLLFCPSALFDEPSTFGAALSLAVGCMEALSHREALRAAVVYVNHIVSKRESTLALYQPIIDSSIAQQTPSLWKALVLLLTTTCPSTVLSTVTHVTFHLLTSYGAAMHSALFEALIVVESPLSEDEKRRVCATWIHMSTNFQERKFVAFVKDYAKVCRKEMPSEQLTDYFVLE
ncbi:hypothetical protein AeMF1_003521 [Aphanomyces euteiches]|nr:hypothetical protein AeMF1_003521 [Aphanomyces euteiches]KAH9186143.1 hypothetical protein AeNC1_011885 [Aphanomyces euteiches]